AIAELAGRGAEDTGAAGILVFLIQDDQSVAVKADRAAVFAADRLLDTNDDALDHIAGLHIATGDRLFDAGNNNVAEAGGAPLRAAQHFDAHAFFGAGVVGHVEIRIHLNHGTPMF